MKKESIDRNIYYGLREDLGEFTSKSGIPIETVTKMFEVFDRDMQKFINDNKEKVKVK